MPRSSHDLARAGQLSLAPQRPPGTGLPLRPKGHATTPIVGFPTNRTHGTMPSTQRLKPTAKQRNDAAHILSSYATATRFQQRHTGWPSALLRWAFRFFLRQLGSIWSGGARLHRLLKNSCERVIWVELAFRLASKPLLFSIPSGLQPARD